MAYRGNVPQVTSIFLIYTSLLLSMSTEKIQVPSGILHGIPYEGVLHNYLIPLIIYMKKLLDSDWLRAVQFKCTVPLKYKLTGSRSSILETQSSILENFEDRGSSWVSRRSRLFENLSSRVSRLSRWKNKGLFARLTFDTSEYFFTGRSILISGP